MNVLLVTSISLALIHTLIGVDHYLPFIIMGQANNWSMKKTMFIVLACGVGHVASSVALGFAGIALSSGVEFLTGIESLRGEIATYFLIAFGLVYTIYGIRQVMKNKTHSHISEDGQTLIHSHLKTGDDHIHGRNILKSKNIFWGLFILFVLGPCEPLIPLIMYPAAMQNVFMLLAVTFCFAFFTISTMLTMTFLGLKGIRLLKINKLEKYSHVLAGSSILACGITVLALPI